MYFKKYNIEFLKTLAFSFNNGDKEHLQHVENKNKKAIV